MLTTIVTFLYTVLGAIMNRVRGGAFTDYVKKKGWFIEEARVKSLSKIANDVVFALVFAVLIGKFSLFFIFVLYLAMLGGRCLGWGRYIGSIIRKETDPYDDAELPLVDRYLLNTSDQPVFRNTLALSIRGAIWGTSLAAGFIVATGQFWYLLLIPISALMGLTYLISVETCEMLKNNRDSGWQMGEMFYGSILWGSTALISNLIIG